MQKKRTASLPIFNRGNKRPRQALLTHPNNVDGVCSQQQQQQQNAHWNAQACVQNNQPRYSSANNDQSRSNIPAFTHLPAAGRPTGRYTGKENTHPTPFQGTKNTYSQATHGSNQRLSYNITGRSSYKGPSGYTPHDTGHSSNWPENKGVHSQPSTHHVNTHSTNKSFSSMHMAPEVSVPGRAIEPTHHHSAKPEPSPPSHVSIQKPSLLPRVLTATAKGVEHWSKYKAHIPMLFEIFGTLNSAVVAGPLNSREFRVQAGDGTLQCLYWEIDTTLPHIVRGKPLRVMGSWDERQRWIKCHSVREVSQQDMQYSQQMIAHCDTNMRETVMRLPEM